MSSVRGRNVRVLLVTPPMVQWNTPYPATPQLAGFLRRQGLAVGQADLSLELALWVFSAAGVRAGAAEMRRRGPGSTPSVRHFLAQAEAYAATVDPVVRFLQGKDPALAYRIAGRSWLPEGPRFAVLAERAAAGAAAGGPARGAEAVDFARHLASLYLDDLADAVREGVDERFGFSRYAERLSVQAPFFAPLRAALCGRLTLLDRVLGRLTRAALEAFQPDLVAVTAPFPGTVYGAFRVARAVKAARPRARTVLGGGYVSTELRALAEPDVFADFDYVILDDGELPLLRLAEHLAGRRPAARLVRTFVCREGRVVPLHDPKARDLPHRRRPAPDYGGLPLDRYVPVREMANPMHGLWSDARWNKLALAHGCYWRRCAFCDTALPYIRRYEPAPARTVQRWIRAVCAQTGSSGFHFTDEAMPPAVVSALSDLLRAEGPPISWWGNIRFEKSFTRELAGRMARAGCIAVTGALETASARTLALMTKGITLEQAARVTANFSRSGVLVHAYLMYGFPTETARETVDALEYVRQLFAAGCLQSVYWHRFALTVHSPIMADPAAFGIRVAAPDAPFARNEAGYSEAAPADHDALGAGLRRAAYNYMHGVGLGEDVRAWFDIPVPRPALPKRFVEQALRPE